MRYHGNWCGPNWSDGRATTSTRGYAPPIDEFDSTCRDHDFALADNPRDPAADHAFIKANIHSLNPKRQIAAALVGLRNWAEPIPVKPHKQNMSKNKTKTKQPNKKGEGVKRDTVRLAPVAIATRKTGNRPVVRTLPDGGVVVAHRSFLRSVENDINYTVTSVACNPGLSGSFPWLGKLARRYEQYRFKKLKYEFRSVSASSSMGVVMMSFDYDAADAAPVTKAEQSQTLPNTETNVWMNNDLSVKPDNVWRFIRAGTLGSNLDVKTYDLGNFQISSCYGTGVTGGELYVEYEVELRRPTDGPEVSGKFSCDTGSFAAPINATNATITGAAFPFIRTSNTDLTAVSSGEFLMCCEVNGTVMTAAMPVPTIVSGGTSSAVSSLFSVVGASNTSRTLRIRVDVGDVVTFANAGTGATISNTRVYVASATYTSF